MPGYEYRGSMKTIDALLTDPRVTVRRSGEPDPEGRCVIYWTQRAQRAFDNPALTAAVEADGFARNAHADFYLRADRNPLDEFAKPIGEKLLPLMAAIVTDPLADQTGADAKPWLPG